jgi:predicted MFS family arabinose efflux permease
MLTSDRTASSLVAPGQQRFLSPLMLWSSAIFALQIGVARLGYGLALPAIRSTLHGDYTLYGTINAISLGGYLVGALFAPAIMRRSRNAVLISSIVAGVALLISAFANDTLVFGAARTLFGLASGVSLVAAAVQTLESVDAHHRGGASAIMWGGIGAGLVVSAFGAGWLSHGGLDWRIASFASGVVTIVAGVGYALSFHPKAPAAKRAGSERPRLRALLFLCLSYFSFGFAYIAYATFIIASITAQMGVANARTTIECLWAFYGVMSIVGTIVVGRMLDGPLGRYAMVFTGTASALGCAATFLSPHTEIFSAALVGLGLSATPAAATAIARARSTVASAPAAIAAVTVVVGIGQLAGPIVAGISADRFGLDSVALVACCVYALQAIGATIDARSV